MKKNQKLKLAAAISASVFLAACGSDSDSSSDNKVTTNSGYTIPNNATYVAPNAASGDDISEALSTAMFNAESGDVLVLPKGEFTVSQTIVKANGQNIVVTGYGKDETKLDFSSSTQDDGIRFDGGTNITIRDLGVYEAPKNAIKADGVNGIHMIGTSVVWESPLDDGDPDTTNGAYGLYPVSSQNVLVEENYAYGSADAGIYVGQSSNIVVRNNIAEHNVAGIEIENSTYADVYDNEALGNTAGVLIFDLPGLDKAYGGNVRVFNNNTHDNNLENYGVGAVGIAPPGTGVLIFATSDVEVYNNTISDNETSGIEIASYFMSDDDLAEYMPGGKYADTVKDGWTPIISNIFIHNNTFHDNGANPRGELITEIVQGYSSAFNSSGEAQRFPAILYGGVGELLANGGVLANFDPAIGPYTDNDKICIGEGNINNNSDALKDDLNVGQVYGTDPTNLANWSDVGTPEQAPKATLLIDQMENKSLLDCSLARLESATVTINGTTYGCNGDDSELAACKL